MNLDRRLCDVRSLVCLALFGFVLACSDNASTPSATEKATEPALAGEGDEPPGGPSEGGDEPGPDAGAPAKPSDAGAGDAGGDAAPPGDPPFTKAEVQALLNARCAPCHVGNASAGLSLAGDFTAATVGVASAQVAGMQRIKAGDKEASYLFHKIRGTHLTVGGTGLRMPRNGPPYLSDSEIDRIGKFIDAL